MQSLWNVIGVMYLLSVHIHAENVIACGNITKYEDDHEGLTCYIVVDSWDTYIGCTCPRLSVKIEIDFVSEFIEAVNKSLSEDIDLTYIEKYGCMYTNAPIGPEEDNCIEIKLPDVSKNGNKNMDTSTNGYGFRIRYKNAEVTSKTFEALRNFPNLYISIYSSLNINKDSFRRVKNLQKLDITGTNFEKLPDGIFEPLVNLRELRLDRNNLKYWGNKYFGFAFEKLSLLAIAFNKLESLEVDSFYGMYNLEKLRLKENKIRRLEEGTFNNLTNLKILNLSRNKLSSWKQQYHNGTLVNLTELRLHENNITSLCVDSFEGMINLQILYLAYNTINYIPDDIFSKLDKLEVLHLDKNNLISWNRKSGLSFERLTKLGLSENNLTILYKDDFIGMPKLNTLDLSWNRISYLPDGIFDSLASLTSLDLSHNILKTWTPTPENAPLTGSLNILNLDYNQIETIDQFLFWQLYNLKSLRLSGNYVQTIFPIGYKFPRGLEHLDLSYNKIKDNYIGLEIPAVQTLNLEGNLFEELIPSVYPEYHSAITPPVEYSGNIEVNLKRNNLSRIDLNLINVFRLTDRDKKMEFLIDENPIVCDCFTYNLSIAVRNGGRFGTPRVIAENLTCNSPGEHYGKNLKKMNQDDFTCILTDCPSFCTCTVFGSNLTNLEINCSHAALKHLPTIPGLSSINILSKVILRTISMNLSYNQMSEVVMTENYNFVTILDLSNNFLKSIDWLPPNIEELVLNNNSLYFLNDGIISYLENTSTLRTLKIHDNPWQCSCALANSTRALKDLTKRRVTPIESQLKCINGLSFEDLNVAELCTEAPSGIIAIVFVDFIVILFIVILVAFVLFYLHKTSIKILLQANTK